MNPALLVEIKRGEYVEKQHFGFILAIDKNKNIIYKDGDDNNRKFWMRSAAKPFQASLIIKSGAYKKFGFTLQEMALCCASHTGTDEHIKIVKSILGKIDVSEENLKCGIQEPIDKDARNSLIVEGRPFLNIHNNCSGKHAGMIAVCVMNGWDTENYLDFNHPLQKEIKQTIADFCNFDRDEIDLDRDGCFAPVHALPHYNMGVGYLNLFFNTMYSDIKIAFQENPALIGGIGRLDTEIIRATSGRLVSKVAAEGLCITVNTETQQSLLVKILDAEPKARFIATTEALKRLGWISAKEFNNLLLN